MCGINKSSVNVHGESQVNLVIGGKTCPVDVIIADISSEVVLGNPFIKEYSVLVDLNRGTLTLPDSFTKTVEVEINTAQQIPTVVADKRSKNPVVKETCCKVHCALNTIIPPYHAAWVNIRLESSESPENVLIFPQLNMCTDKCIPGQFVSRISDTNEYKMYISNNTDVAFEIEQNEQLGSADLRHSHEQIPLDLTTMHSDVTINNTYHLNLSSSENELRWTKLCKVLKVDSWKISESEKHQALSRLREFEHVFALENEPLGLMEDYYHEINVGNASPIRMRPRPLTEQKQEELQTIINDLLARGLIRPSRSAWAAPIVLAKKADGSLRLCCDFRLLNKVTVPDAFPIPNINHMLSTMKQSKYFSTMDLASGFHQLKVKPSDIPLTAFVTPDALYEWVVLPFGVRNGPPSFCRAMSSVLKVPKKAAVVYFDDILTIGSTFQIHLENLITVLRILLNANLKLKAAKTTLFALTIEFVGHVISEHGVACSPKKIECIKNIPTPTTPKTLRSYLGFFSYYRKFVPKYSEIARPLYKLSIADKKDFEWSKEADEAFRELQFRLVNAPILTLPTDDDEYILTTDASGVAIGSILTVNRPEGRKVIAYASHLLEKSRKSYGATKRELFSLVYYVQYFKMFLLHKEFTVESDHKCLEFISNFKDPPAIVARWIAILSDYKFKIVHRPATNSMIKVADNLSRITKLDSVPVTQPLRDNFISPLNTSNHNKPDYDDNNHLSENSINDDNCTDSQPTSFDDSNHLPVSSIADDNCTVSQPTSFDDSNHLSENSIADDNCTVSQPTSFDDSNNLSVNSINDDNCTVSQPTSFDDSNHLSVNSINDDNCTVSQPTSFDDSNHLPVSSIIDDNNAGTISQPTTPDDSSHLPVNSRSDDIDVCIAYQSNTLNDIDHLLTNLKSSKDHNSVTSNAVTHEEADQINDSETNFAKDNTLLSYTTSISLAQSKDAHLKLLKTRVLHDNDKTVYDISSDPPVVKFYWSYKQRLKLEDDILYFADSKLSGKYRIIVPHPATNGLLKLAHDDPTAGHRSAGKMLPLLKLHYHWFKMRSYIELYVKQCQSCGAHKKPRTNRPRAPLYQTKVSSRFERLSIDFAGPFNKTQRGNRFVLLGLCNFSKFGFCVPMSNTNSENVARVLMERWICYFGVPLQINSDAGSNLISDVMKHLYRLLNIKLSHSLAYVPQQNGQAERFVSSMRAMIANYAAGNPSKWDHYAPLVSLAYNSQVHSSTKCTPFEMIMGPDTARLPLDFAWGAPPITEDIDEPEYVAFLRDAMYDIHEYARKNLNASLVTTKDRFDKGQFGKPYEKDDLVWRLKGRFEIGSRKFQKRYDGIYIVLKKLSNTSYLIKHLKTYKEEIIHFNRLKRAYLNPLTLQSLLEQMNKPDEFAVETEYEVEPEEPVFIGCPIAPNNVEPLVAPLPVPEPPPLPARLPVQAPAPIAQPPDNNTTRLPRRRAAPALQTRTYNLRPR